MPPALPDTTHGRDFASGLDAAFRELRDVIDQIHSEAAALPSGSGRASANAELSPQVGAALADLQHRIKDDQRQSGDGLTLDCGSA